MKEANRKLIHTSHIKIYKDECPVRRAHIEGSDEPVNYGIHSNIKDFYGYVSEIVYPAPLDHIIAAAAG